MNTNTGVPHMIDHESPEIIEYDRDPPLAKRDRLGKLVLLTKHREHGTKKYLWSCICDCGEVKDIREDHLRSGRVRSCGCQQHAATTGRRNQKSSYRILAGQVRFTVHGYDGNATRPAADRFLYSVGFCAVAKAGAGQGEYFVSPCVSRRVPKGGVPRLLSVALHMLSRNGDIGPRNGLSIPQWAAKYGVDYIRKMSSGHEHIRQVHADIESQQAFSHKGIWP